MLKRAAPKPPSGGEEPEQVPAEGGQPTGFVLCYLVGAAERFYAPPLNPTRR